MLTQEKNQITKQDILEIIKKREKLKNIKYYSFEEAYELGRNYIPKG